MDKQPQSTISIPASFATRLSAVGRLLMNLADDLQASQAGATVRQKPEKVPKDQEWFWTEEWQQGEREVDEALARGEFKDFDTVEELIDELHSHV